MGILTFIRSLPVLIKTTKFWVIAFLLASAIGGVVYFVNDYRETLQELAVAENTIDDLTNEINTVKAKVTEEREKIKELRKSNSIISSNYLNTVRELQNLKNNMELLKKNPTEGSIKIKSSFNNFMNDISCITGDSSQCPE